MSTDYSNLIASGINGTQFAGREADLTSPESQNSDSFKTSGIVFDNLTFDPNVVNLLRKGYNDSFVSIPAPDLSMSQSKQTYTSNLAAIGTITQDILNQETSNQNNPIKAQSVLGEIQQALNAAQQLYNEYYAPGAPHADQVQGYRFPTQEVNNSVMTVQHVAGLALVQTAATPNSEEQSLDSQEQSSSSNTSASRGLTLNKAIYEAGSSFSSLIRNTHKTRRGGNSLEALRKLLVELSVFRSNNSISQRDVAIKKELKDGPRNVLEEKNAEKIASSNNLLYPFSGLDSRKVRPSSEPPRSSEEGQLLREGLASEVNGYNLLAELRTKTASLFQKTSPLSPKGIKGVLQRVLTYGSLTNASASPSTTAAVPLFQEGDKNIESNDNIVNSSTPHLNAAFTSAPNLSNQVFSYHITGNDAAAVDTNTAISLDNGGVEEASTDIINISPSAMSSQLSHSIQQSHHRLSQLIKGGPEKQLNASLF